MTRLVDDEVSGAHAGAVRRAHDISIVGSPG